MYRIAWQRLYSDQQGHGEYVFQTLQEVNAVIDKVNQDYCNELYHWWEREPA